MIGGHDLADPAALHDLTERDALCIVARGTHAATHVRIDRKPSRLGEDVAGPGIGHRLRIHAPTVRYGHSFGVTREEPSPIHDILHSFTICRAWHRRVRRCNGPIRHKSFCRGREVLIAEIRLRRPSDDNEAAICRLMATTPSGVPAIS